MVARTCCSRRRAAPSEALAFTPEEASVFAVVRADSFVRGRGARHDLALNGSSCDAKASASATEAVKFCVGSVGFIAEAGS
jgi:hypothetical protein